ncbi:activator-dependent family glycosyltransferase [Nonomuraea indica]|uniref:activator-dependent family glycosyltransferase n=1 Tax=Nonomuraea indica TaxID=1581193 RepID=UPI000C7DB449|nr:activator-dependent family glycosyltransferase [Nonomuraea indica]
MRVVVATIAENAHLQGMVPVGWALRTAGHEVRVASQPRLADAVAGSGLTAVPVGRDHDLWRVMNAYQVVDGLGERAPLFGRAGRPAEEITWEYVRDGYRQVVPWWWRMVNDPMIDDLVAYCREWRPDLVIWGPVTFAGAVAAKVTGAAHARLVWGADKFALMRGHFLRLRDEQPPETREDPLAEWLGGRLARYGERFSEDLACGQLTVDCVPGSLRPGFGADVPRVPMRYVPYNGRSVVPDWLRRPPERPRVALTMGISAASRQDERMGTGQALLDALSGLDVEVVATLSAKQQAELTRVPADVRLVGYAPLHALAPTCAAVVHHGGWGTLATLTACGVPQLMLPNPLDQPLLARAVARQGAGLALAEGETTAAHVRAGLERLLAGPSFAEAARRLRAEALAMPSPNEVVPELERLTEERRSRTPAGAPR